MIRLDESPAPRLPPARPSYPARPTCPARWIGRCTRGARGILCLGVLIALVGCSNAGDRVAVLGDSITALDTEAMTEVLGDVYRLDISGNFGATTAQVLPEARDMARVSYDQVIINLGTNDVLQGLPAGPAVDNIAQMAAMFESARCVHVVTVNEHMVDPLTGQFTGQRAATFNEALRSWAESRDRVSVIDWNEVAAQHLNDATPPTSLLTDDSIHPTDEGNEELNELYADALGDCPPAF